MKLKEVNHQLKNYRNVLRKVTKNREEWSITKDLIFNTLNTIVKKTKMNAEVKKEDKVGGLELIYLFFGKRDSGIFERIGETKHPYLKEGGYLFYTQIYSGKISVWMSQPVIENIIDMGEPIQINTYCPADLKEETIVEHVAEFLKKMIEWEGLDIDYRREIGFRKQPLSSGGDS